jgi:hypothetical protein
LDIAWLVSSRRPEDATYYAMPPERTLPRQIVELYAENLATAVDFARALKKVIGAPDWHGNSVDAFLDSMIHHEDINALKAPYTIKIVGADKAKPEALGCDPSASSGY